MYRCNCSFAFTSHAYDSISNHRQLSNFLNTLFKLLLKKISKFRINDLLWMESHRLQVESPINGQTSGRHHFSLDFVDKGSSTRTMEFILDQYLSCKELGNRQKIERSSPVFYLWLSSSEPMRDDVTYVNSSNPRSYLLTDIKRVQVGTKFADG